MREISVRDAIHARPAPFFNIQARKSTSTNTHAHKQAIIFSPNQASLKRIYLFLSGPRDICIFLLSVSFLQSRYLVDTSRYLVDTSRYLVDTSRYLVDTSRYLVDTSRCSLLSGPLAVERGFAGAIYASALPCPFVPSAHLSPHLFTRLSPRPVSGAHHHADRCTMPSAPSSASTPIAHSARFVLPPSLRQTADVILQSSEGAQFRVHKSYLAASSSFFEQMFHGQSAAPPPYGGSGDVLMEDAGGESAAASELPIVPVSEDRHTLRALLPCIYPGTKVRPPSLRVLKHTLIAAEKYDIPSARDSMRPHLIWPEFLTSNPLLVFSISRLLGFAEEREMAMDVLFQLKEDALYALDMEGVPASDLADVHLKRQQRADTIVKTVRDVLAMDEGARTPANCHRPVCIMCKKVPMWVYVWSKRLELEARRRPTVDKLFSFSALELARQKSPRCRCSAELIFWDAKSFEDLKKIVDESLKPERAKRRSSRRTRSGAVAS
ncbi:hypothetical protein CALCODRAFT_481155 [Calocera cornea HHB12733]|uniref:BTB domain-containing protein n=1 Tax=Calocera cornea HHB12733 TaxID=1353952 RepID=A0A165HWU3_9BASI|nr:hypothetical protein CALCODRAFT_481155 [Calocera cornea HHB12733]